MGWEEFNRKIRSREGKSYDLLYRIAKKIKSVEFPVIPFVHTVLYRERLVRISAWHNFWRLVYYQPMFRTRCESVGKNLNLIGGIPQVAGHLKIFVGEEVQMHGASTFSGSKVFERPTLRIGNNVRLGYQLGIAVGRDVTIGNNVGIANRVTIYSHDLHPVDEYPRKHQKPAPPESSRPVVIEEDVMIGSSVVILKGTTIGQGSVIGAGSVVSGNIPPYCIAAGNPAVVRKNIINFMDQKI